MPDITMCANDDCPHAETCHRNPASGTEPVPPKESTSSPVDLVQLHRRERSSAGERLLHTQDVTGSIPVVPTVPDPLADMLANPNLPRHITEPLGRRLIDATAVLNMPEDLA